MVSQIKYPGEKVSTPGPLRGGKLRTEQNVAYQTLTLIFVFQCGVLFTVVIEGWVRAEVADHFHWDWNVALQHTATLNADGGLISLLHLCSSIALPTQKVMVKKVINRFGQW